MEFVYDVGHIEFVINRFPKWDDRREDAADEFPVLAKADRVGSLSFGGFKGCAIPPILDE